MKSGYKTSEFWLTLLIQVVPVTVITGVLSEAEATTVTEMVSQSIEAIFALAVSLGTIWKYIDSRAKIKMANGSK